MDDIKNTLNDYMNNLAIFDSPTAIGKRIRNIRLKRKETTEDFAKHFDPPASKGTISKWENGKYMPNAQRLQTIADLGNIDINELLYGGITERVISLSTPLLENSALPKDIQHEIIEATISVAEKRSINGSVPNDYLNRLMVQNIEASKALNNARKIIKSSDEAWLNKTTNEIDSTKSYIDYIKSQLTSLIEDAKKQKDIVNVRSMNEIIDVLERSKQELDVILDNFAK